VLGYVKDIMSLASVFGELKWRIAAVAYDVPKEHLRRCILAELVNEANTVHGGAQGHCFRVLQVLWDHGIDPEALDEAYCLLDYIIIPGSFKEINARLPSELVSLAFPDEASYVNEMEDALEVFDLEETSKLWGPVGGPPGPGRTRIGLETFLTQLFAAVAVIEQLQLPPLRDR
jgi:hypothetical protein